MEAFGLLLHGFAVLLTWKTLALMMVGLVLGIFVGVLPGLGGPNGVAILLPLTFTMDPTSAIVMLSCIYWGALFGGAITSILFNIPGEAWSVAHDLRLQRTIARHQLPGRGDRAVRDQRNPADDGGAPGAAGTRRQHQPARGLEGLERSAEILGDVIALVVHRLLAWHHTGRR